VGAITATVVTSVVLLVIVTHFTWDVLQSRDSGLFYRVNALHLESEADGALRDPVAMGSILLFNVVTFGVPGILGAQLYPRRWWAAAAALASLGVALWLLRFGLLLLMPASLGAKVASIVDLTSMVVSAIGGARLGRRRAQQYVHAG
jgi:hypothetical protein